MSATTNESPIQSTDQWANGRASTPDLLINSNGNSNGYTTGRSLSANRITLGFWHCVHAEIVKLMSLASTWWILGISVVLIPAFGAIGMWGVRFASTLDETGNTLSTPRPISASTFWNVLSSSVSTMSFVLGILGVLAITTEYTTSSIQASLTVNPRRVMFMNAKATALALFAFVATLFAQLIALGVGLLVLVGSSMDKSVFDPSNGSLPYVVLFGSPVALTLVALLALGLGGICRSTVGGMFSLFGLLMIVPMIISLAGAFISSAGWLLTLTEFLPDRAIGHFLSADDAGSTQAMAGLGSTFDPAWWQSGLILLAWAVVIYAIGVLVVDRGDVT